MNEEESDTLKTRPDLIATRIFDCEITGGPMRESLIQSIVERWMTGVGIAIRDCDPEEVEEVNRRIGVLIAQSGPQLTAYLISERERKVINAMVQGWDENDNRSMPGHVSYQDVLDLVAKFDLDPPKNTLAFLARYDKRFKGWQDLFDAKIIDEDELRILQKHGTWDTLSKTLNDDIDDLEKKKVVRRYMLSTLMAKGIVNSKMSKTEAVAVMLREARS